MRAHHGKLFCITLTPPSSYVWLVFPKEASRKAHVFSVQRGMESSWEDTLWRQEGRKNLLTWCVDRKESREVVHHRHVVFLVVTWLVFGGVAEAGLTRQGAGHSGKKHTWRTGGGDTLYFPVISIQRVSPLFLLWFGNSPGCTRGEAAPVRELTHPRAQTTWSIRRRWPWRVWFRELPEDRRNLFVIGPTELELEQRHFKWNDLMMILNREAGNYPSNDAAVKQRKATIRDFSEQLAQVDIMSTSPWQDHMRSLIWIARALLDSYIEDPLPHINSNQPWGSRLLWLCKRDRILPSNFKNNGKF